MDVLQIPGRTLFLRRILAVVCVLLLAMMLIPIQAFAVENDPEVIRVGYYENEVFQEGAGDGLVKTGYAYEYYRKISEYTGWKYEYVYGGFSELYQMLLDGKIDLLAGLAYRDDREGLISYPDAAMGSESYYLVRHDTDTDITQDTDTLNGKKIGVLDSVMVSTLNAFLQEHAIQAEVTVFPDYTGLFGAFDSHEVDILVAESDGAYGRDHAVPLLVFGSTDYYLCVSIQRPDLLSSLNEAQSRLAEEEPNFLYSLSAKYYPASITARAFSEAELEWISSHDTLHIGYLENYLPYSDTDKQGQVIGLIKDYIPDLLEGLGIGDLNVTYTGYEKYDDMIAAMNAGEIDTAFPVGGGLYYSEVNGINQSHAVASASSELVYHGEFSEEKLQTFAVNENNRMQYYYVRTNYPDAEITLYPSIEDCLEAVLSGEVGVTTLNGLRANDILRNSKYEGLSMQQTARSDDRCFGVEIGNEGLLKLLNRGITILGSDYAQNISYRYTSGLYTYGFVDMLRDHMTLFASAILAVIALIIFLLVRDSRRNRTRLKEKELLLEQQALQKQQDQMITAMASDYRSVYYVDLDKDEAICYRDDPRFSEAPALGASFPFLRDFTAFAYNHVAEPYREDYLAFIQPENIRAALATQQIIAYRFLELNDGKESYAMLRMAGVRHPEDRDDHIVHAIVVGFSDIDEDMRKSLTQQQALRDALDTAEQANRAKTAFLSNMSHEIRTPMNAIIGLNNIAMNDPTASDKVKEYLEKIGASARHLLGIINDILDMSRIESGRMVIKKEEFSFSKNLEQVNNMIGGQCRDKGIHYECRIIGKIDDYYIGDAMKLKQVMLNILGNAVKFTPEGGKVTFLIEEGHRFDDMATLHLTFKDTGIGMSKEYIPHIFEAFSQEDSSSTSKYGSTGLGMPITKSIVELMNGTIEVESEKGAGTTFTVTVTLEESGRKDTLAADGDLNPHDMSVLVIDDDRIALEHAEVILGQIGISCETAESGWEGIDKVRLRHGRQEEYDLILVDWKMPELDGVETTRQIRQIVGNDTPIIILTSFNWDDVADEARAAGVDTFVAKPLFAGSVMDEFREAFRRKNEALAKKTADLKGRRILLAEDVQVNAEIMMMVLGMREMEVDHAENGQEAVNLFASHDAGYYSAILMDMRMPIMDGLEATKVIRAMEREDAKSIPIIALTANAFDEDVQHSLQAGLDAHLSKPVEPEILFGTLEKLIPAI